MPRCTEVLEQLIQLAAVAGVTRRAWNPAPPRQYVQPRCNTRVGGRRRRPRGRRDLFGEVARDRLRVGERPQRRHLGAAALPGVEAAGVKGAAARWV